MRLNYFALINYFKYFTCLTEKGTRSVFYIFLSLFPAIHFYIIYVIGFSDFKAEVV